MTNQQLSELVFCFKNACSLGCGSQFEDLIGQDIYPKLLGRMLSQFAVAPGKADKYDDFLNEIPTETTIAERKLLFNFFSRLWSGQYNVLEVGPFLGGSTRAIALGMQVNPDRLQRCKLYTFDKFEDYYKPERLEDFLRPLFDRGVLKDDVKRKIKESSDFQNIFYLIHCGYEYYDLIKHEQRILPSLPDQSSSLNSLFKLPVGIMYDAIFVDGCKSWYATKYFMTELSNSVAPDSYFIFQDYGAFTCFWIPIFVGVMPEYFKLVSYVDNTYVFRLIKPLDAAEISQRFPDSPELMGRANFDIMFTELLKQAMSWNDTFTLINFQLQHAAAMAYLGERTEARNKIVNLLKRPEYNQFRNWILKALNIPTYRPLEGNICL